MKKTNSIILLIAFGITCMLLAVHIDRCQRPPQEPSEIQILLNTLQTQLSISQQEISRLGYVSDSLQQEVIQSQYREDSLRNLKQQIKIVYEGKITALQAANTQSQYNILLSYLDRLQLPLNGSKWQTIYGDTFLLINRPDLISINTAGIYHQECEESLQITESLVNELDFQIGLVLEDLKIKDTIIQWKDTIINAQEKVIEPLIQENKKIKKQNKVLKWAVGIVTTVVIIQSIRR